jgi:hypothetical protein
MKRSAGKLTFANVMSVIAVFIALGGSAVAVTQVPKNSVGANQIKKNAVSSSKVKDFSLQAKDFAEGSLPAGAAGPKGEPGPQGPAGPPGTPGAPGTSSVSVYAFVRTGGCCGGALPLDPPQIINGHGVTAAKIISTGQYEISFDTSLLPGGTVENCVPIASLGSSDAGSSVQGGITFMRAPGFPGDKLIGLFRNSAGTPVELSTGGGSDGFSIALLC